MIAMIALKLSDFLGKLSNYNRKLVESYKIADIIPCLINPG
tara:strand:- start:309 stop:431 length:123 start_codon:yes stop_codon:yes gene_type:complete